MSVSHTSTIYHSIKATSLRSLSTYQSISLNCLSPKVKQFVEENAKICKPDNIHVCDGSVKENEKLLEQLQREGRLKKLMKYDNW